jgi:transcriptional regulator with XRE-family HTH domain
VSARSASRNLAAIVGANIRTARLAAGLSQNDLAQRVGGKASLTQVSAWERGISRPSDDRLILLAETLGRDVGWFFTEHEQNGETVTA